MEEKNADEPRRRNNMSKKLSAANERIRELEKVLKETNLPEKNEKVRLGVDLGTAYIVLVALGEDDRPLALEMEYAEVVRDGLVVEGAGLDVTEILDEPTAANGVLGITDGAIVDIGGGTTGISILQNGKVVYVADEATGGTHLSLVLAGHFRIPFGDAENMKKDPKKQNEIMGLVRPVVEKMASIVKRHIEGYDVHDIYLVGGTCCLVGIEKVFEDALGIPVSKPKNPFLVTPLGIAKGSEKP